MDDNKTTKKMSTYRFGLAVGIIVISLGLLIFVTNKLDITKHWETAFTAIVGLVGTWVGTVIAFYFSKENFDAASASTQKLVDSITSKEKLSSTTAKEAMIPINKVKLLVLEKGIGLEKYILKELKDTYLTTYNRLPILNADKTIFGIAHKSLIVEFIAEQAINGKKPEDLSLKDLLDDPKIKSRVEGFGTMDDDDVLVKAKRLMEKLSVGEVICHDIFITKDGSKNTEVIGWITNVEITKHSIV